MRKKQHVNTNRTNDKPWFNQSCKNLRNIYHRTRRAYNKYKTVYFKNLLKDVSKQYKSKLRKADNDFNEKRAVNLRRLKSKHPREYWNMLNSGSKTSNVKASVDDLFSYLKSINENNSNETVHFQDFEMNFNIDAQKHHLNQPITANEISKAINKLKNHKAPGVDEIVNEHLKHSISFMLPLYVNLFNVVFDTGVIPDSWTVGLIKPIYKQR